MSDCTTNLEYVNGTTQKHESRRSVPAFELFFSSPKTIAQKSNTSFSRAPTKVTSDKARTLLKFDYSTIRFKDGYRLGDNFERALAVPGDIDNGHSEDPNEWRTAESVSAELTELGINHWWHSSRNDNQPKNGAASREKFHVIFPLSEPLTDKEKYIAFCKWFIGKFNGDQQVKSLAQVLYGFGDHPEPRIGFFDGGKCIDEVLTDADLAVVATAVPSCSVKKPKARPALASQPVFATELTPEIKELAIACLNEAESAVQGDRGHNALLSVAFKLVRGLQIEPTLAAAIAWEQYNPRCTPPWSDEERSEFDRKFTEAAKLPLWNQPEGWLLPSVGSNLLMPMVSETCLQDILHRVERTDFRKESGVKAKKSDYVVVCVDHVQKQVQGNTSGLCTRNNRVFCYTGSYWKGLEDAEFISFLTAAAIRMGVPRIEAKHHKFGDDLFEQFLCVAHLPAPAGNGKTKINLRNGTFVVSNDSGSLQPFDPADFLTYQLPFDFDPQAEAPKFREYLDRVLPEQELQDILAEYVGYIFARDLKLEKVAMLFGNGANGKSVIADTLNAMLGKENVCGFSLQNITKSDSWQRAELEHKLLNYSSEISGKMESDMFKKMVSGEPVEAHRKYKDPYTMDSYARMMFNCNLLPHEVELTDGFFRRLLIIPFRVQIPEEEQNPDLAKEIIASELSGVFNWVLTGLSRLLKQRKFSKSPIVQGLVKEYRTECDTVAMFLEAKNIRPGKVKVHLKYLRQEYAKHCEKYDYRAVGGLKFSGRLRSLGFNHGRDEDGMVYYCNGPHGSYHVVKPMAPLDVESVENVD